MGKLILAIIIVLLIILGLRAYNAKAPVAVEEEAVYCAMDVMMCPDGTEVGRTGPNCEFVCPVGGIEISVE